MTVLIMMLLMMTMMMLMMMRMMMIAMFMLMCSVTMVRKHPADRCEKSLSPQFSYPQHESLKPEEMEVAENRGPKYSTLNSRILIIRTPR